MDNKKRPPYASCFVIQGLDLLRASDLVLIFYPPSALHHSIFLVRYSIFSFSRLSALEFTPGAGFSVSLPGVFCHLSSVVSFQSVFQIVRVNQCSKIPHQSVANSSLCALWLKQNPRNRCNPWLKILLNSLSPLCALWPKNPLCSPF